MLIGARRALLVRKAVAVATTIPFAVTYISDSGLTGSTATWTFTSQAIGAASATRIIVIGIAAQAGTGITVSSVTVGGNSATKATGAGLTNASNGAAGDIWYYADAGALGTAATILVNWSASITRTAIAVYNVTGTGSVFSTGASNGSTSSVSTLTQSATIPSGGGAIAVATLHTATGGTVTTTNLTSDISNGLVFGTSTILAGHNASSSGSTSMGFSWGGTATDCTLSIATFTA
jgi:hypothetical protein